MSKIIWIGKGKSYGTTSCMKEARFPESWGLYCRLPEPQLAWEIYGDFHIWRQSMAEEFFF